MTLLDLKDLETHLWEAAHIITGPIDASDYKTYIFPYFSLNVFVMFMMKS